MLLFIQRKKRLSRYGSTFQYISCYSLSSCVRSNDQFHNQVSIHLMLLFIIIRISCKPEVIFLFQYISCYSLSIDSQNAGTRAILFQYISCYSLSLRANAMTGKNVRFNTSHVTLYRLLAFLKQWARVVSIHLMLLFIVILKISVRIIYRFQYISCYSLSKKGKKYLKVFNTFQYISCYSLSKDISKANISFACFNTSHVTLYRDGFILLHGHIMFQYISCYSLSPCLVVP